MKIPQTIHNTLSKTDDLVDLECGVSEDVFQFVYRIAQIMDAAESNGLSGYIMMIHLIGLAYYGWTKTGFGWGDDEVRFTEVMVRSARHSYEHKFRGVPILDY